jgi:hypothetical protein
MLQRIVEKKSRKNLIYPPGQEIINQGRVGLRHGTSHDPAVLLLNSENVNELNNLRGSHSLKNKDFRVMWRPIPETCLSFFYECKNCVSGHYGHCLAPPCS